MFEGATVTVVWGLGNGGAPILSFPDNRLGL